MSRWLLRVDEDIFALGSGFARKAGMIIMNEEEKIKNNRLKKILERDELSIATALLFFLRNPYSGHCFVVVALAVVKINPGQYGTTYGKNWRRGLKRDYSNVLLCSTRK